MVNKTLLAHWCYNSNFGDALNPWLLERLSGLKVKYCNTFEPKIHDEILNMLRSFLHLRKYDFRRMKRPITDRPIILPVGSIISRSRPNFVVWGGGYMSTEEKCAGGGFKAVRGPFSARKLKEENGIECNVYGDPALLLPLVYTPSVIQRFDVGIVPHLRDLPNIKQKYLDKKVIALTDKIENIINDIYSCEFVVSTSLHGVITAHAYGVPAIWVKQGYIYTDGIKFNDYFASVGIPLYDGASLNFDELVNAKYAEIPNEIKRLMLPKKPIVEIQRSLLNVAPFPVKQKILDKVNM